MIGTNSNTGKALKGYEHLRQSIRNILTTPVGSRVMRREYGSRLFELIDAPMNAETMSEFYIATAEALDRWEPRFKLTNIAIEPTADGQVNINLEGVYLPDGKRINLEGLVI